MYFAVGVSEKDILIFNMVKYLKAAIIILIVLLCIKLILNKLGIKLKSDNVNIETRYLSKNNKRDKKIEQAEINIAKLTNIVQNSMFRVHGADEEYLNYNIKRVGKQIAGRDMTGKEYNARLRLYQAIILLIGTLLFIINEVLGIAVIMFDVMLYTKINMMIIRFIVKERDRDIKNNFLDFYLPLHYVLIDGGNTPLSKVMKSYEKTVSNKSMKDFVNRCIHDIETYGEYKAPKYIQRDFKEIGEVVKLMRLITQANEVGNIRNDLMGFKNELLEYYEHEKEKEEEKIKRKAQRSYYIIMPILIQALVSAMAIYVADIYKAKI